MPAPKWPAGIGKRPGREHQAPGFNRVAPRGAMRAKLSPPSRQLRLNAMLKSERAERMALWAERKAEEAATSNAPWALGNLRIYQNMASKFWKEHFAEARKETP